MCSRSGTNLQAISISTQTIDTQEIDIGFGISNLYRFKNFTIILFGDLNSTGAAAPRSVVMSNN